jgi:hypothetical protein
VGWVEAGGWRGPRGWVGWVGRSETRPKVGGWAQVEVVGIIRWHLGKRTKPWSGSSFDWGVCEASACSLSVRAAWARCTSGVARASQPAAARGAAARGVRASARAEVVTRTLGRDLRAESGRVAAKWTSYGRT